MLAKTFDCHKKCDTIREIKLRRGSGLLEQRVARGALIRAGVKWLDSRSCPVNPDVIRLKKQDFMSFRAIE